MLDSLTFKDRVFIASASVLVILYWMALFISSRSMLGEGLIIFTRQYGYIAAMSIFSGLGSIALLCLTMHLYRQTGRDFFRWLWGAYSLELIKYLFIIFQAFNPDRYELHSRLFTQIQVYTVNISSIIAACILIYAFASYSAGRNARHEQPTGLRARDIGVLALATVITVLFCIIPDLLSPGWLGSTAMSASRLVQILSPIFLLWLALFQYRRTRKVFFKLYAWGFFVAILVLLVEYSTWYFLKLGIFPPYSFESSGLWQQLAVVMNWIKVILNLFILSLQVYALALFKSELTPPVCQNNYRSDPFQSLIR